MLPVPHPPQPSRKLELQPVAAARRGRAPIGFALPVPEGIELELPEASNEPLARCSERDGDRSVGVLELDVFTASLVMDPDRALADTATAALARLAAGGVARARPPQAFERDDGIHGVRLHADLVRDRGGARPPLPYVTIVALAGPSVRGGVLLVARAADESWEAGDAMLESLQVLDRDRGGGRGGMKMPLASR